MLRGQHLFLIPGDSPLGLRLPLPSLPWVAPRKRRNFSPIRWRIGAPAGPPRHVASGPTLQSRAADRTRQETGAGQSAPWIVRTALCVEPRDGRLHVFMPPQSSDRGLRGFAGRHRGHRGASGDAGGDRGLSPPHRRPLNQIKVTPDPGVIEVNVHPAHNWQELVGSSPPRFMKMRANPAWAPRSSCSTDGIPAPAAAIISCSAGRTPADSPFLRRPDLLRSMIGYWLNHPSLSYLFSGDVHRADQPGSARRRKPARQSVRAGDRVQPDSAIRAGSVVRRGWSIASFATSWWTSPATRTAPSSVSTSCTRRIPRPAASACSSCAGFEMPPHARMSLTQQLLVRALLAWFWNEPYLRDPIHWGTQLHDQFMLPHFVSPDFRGVLDDLSRAGYPFEPQWFAPHFEFRYPLFGRVNHAGIDIELRQATEPWYVLGEEPGGGGTARFVDSSVERLQIKADGLTSDRYVIACNGRRVPLHPTGTNGEWVAGVRYRAWQPPSCLHPTIPVHTPLIFDVVDSWAGRSIGGCTYHVAHPGGRTTKPFRSTPMRPTRAARRVSSPLATLQLQWRTRCMRSILNSQRPSICDARRPLTVRAADRGLPIPL